MFVILGATGKVGYSTVRTLLGAGLPVRAVGREGHRLDELRRLGAAVAIADLNDAVALERATDGAVAIQVICPMLSRSAHAAGDMRSVIDVIVEVLGTTRPACVLAISDYGAHIASGTGVTLTFHYLESALQRLETSLILLRSAEHMQNWSRFIPGALRTGVLPSLHHPVSKLFPMISAPDLGPIAADLLMQAHRDSGARVMHAEGPRRYCAVDVAQALSEVAMVQVTARAVPRPEWAALLAEGGVGRSYATLVEELYEAHNAGRIDVEPGAGAPRHGTTDLRTVLHDLTNQLMRDRARAPRATG